jgi:tripartite-type tricarboxylate transporter receptor subunit TctC
MATAFALAMGATPAFAQSAYPSKAVRLVVPYAAGGATDIVARALAEKLTEQWHQAVVVDNRPGAGTTLAADAISRAAPDGYTLYMTTSAHTISASIYKKLQYDAIKDFTPITLVTTVPLVLVTSPALKVDSASALLNMAKQKPNGIAFASPGNGTAQHLAGELFKAANHVEMVHVPYKGDAPAITDLLAGQVQIMFATTTAVLPQIGTGKLKPLALANGKRLPVLPNVPTFKEAGLGDFEAATWFGLLAPAQLPADLRKKIYADVSKIVATPQMKQKIEALGGEVNNSTPEQFEKFMHTEQEKWAKAVSVSGARID